MPLSKIKRKVIQDFFKSKQKNNNEWICCDQTFSNLNDMGRHVDKEHAAEIDNLEQLETVKQQQAEETADKLLKLKQRRGEKGSSDPIQVKCQCEPNVSKVILFYKYVNIEDPVQFALDHEHYCANMTGKVRISQEGINATLAGTNKDIDTYLNWITHTQPFSDRDDLKEYTPLDPGTNRYLFFKPSEGCFHVFADLSLKLVDEICPLGQTTVILDKLQQPSHSHGKLKPDDFHKALLKRHDKDVVLLDTRNYYESKIGHFQGAIQPPIRKFSQFPEYIERNKDALKGKTILTYCTGGIRCEKATAYMRQALPDEDIFMLDGGIHNYMEWWKKQPSKDPIWKGKNYVFDARQSLGLEGSVPVSHCQVCHKLWDKYQKCASSGCHLLVLCCDNCFHEKVYCCQDCEEGVPNGSCACEQSRREKELEQIQV